MVGQVNREVRFRLDIQIEGMQPRKKAGTLNGRSEMTLGSAEITHRVMERVDRLQKLPIRKVRRGTQAQDLAAVVNTNPSYGQLVCKALGMGRAQREKAA